MRAELAALRQAGIHRACFSGKVTRVDRSSGHIALKDVQTPLGPMDHAWIRRGHWHALPPHTGDEVEFLANIASYLKADGTEDFGLFNVQLLEGRV